MPCGSNCGGNGGRCCNPGYGPVYRFNNRNCQKDLNKFFNKPKINTWIESDKEIILFQEVISVCNGERVNVDTSITAEVVGLSCNCKKKVPRTAFNTFRLYINGCRVTQSGFEVNHESSLDSASMTWSGRMSGRKTLVITVTAQLTIDVCTCCHPSPTNTALVSSNVSNLTGNFKGTKGAFLRVFIN